jgi:hypothetical protein
MALTIKMQNRQPALKIYAIETAPSSTILSMGNISVRMSLPRGGISPQYVRTRFDEAAVKVHFDTSLDDETISEIAHAITDFMVWGWIPVFSTRGMHIASEAGCAKDEFVPCTIGRDHLDGYMHLPAKSYDVIDIEKSIFQIIIQNDPPMYLHPTELTLTADLETLPSCFRVPHPKTAQVIGDLFVTTAFLDKWKAAGLSGAKFRKL